MVAKPRSKYSYCNVCKADYNDYLTVFFRKFSTSKLINTKTTLKTINSVTLSTKWLTSSKIKLSLPSKNLKKKNLRKIYKINSSSPRKNRPFLKQALALEVWQIWLLEAIRVKQLMHGNHSKVSTCFSILMKITEWFLRTITKEFKPVHLFLLSNDTPKLLKEWDKSVT